MARGGGGTSLKEANGNMPLVGIDNWVDYNGVAFSIVLLEWGRTFSDFLG